MIILSLSLILSGPTLILTLSPLVPHARVHPQSLPRSSYNVGTKLSKQFEDGGVYVGEIISILPYEEGDTCSWYLVQYTDGDEESMSEKEVRRYVRKYLEE